MCTGEKTKKIIYYIFILLLSGGWLNLVCPCFAHTMDIDDANTDGDCINEYDEGEKVWDTSYCASDHYITDSTRDCSQTGETCQYSAHTSGYFPSYRTIVTIKCIDHGVETCKRVHQGPGVFTGFNVKCNSGETLEYISEHSGPPEPYCTRSGGVYVTRIDSPSPVESSKDNGNSKWIPWVIGSCVTSVVVSTGAVCLFKYIKHRRAASYQGIN